MSHAGPGRLLAALLARPVSFALQGGGAHGAFTWGVLDRLLDEPRVTLAGASGASAGAMNAAVLVSGWQNGGRQGARDALERFWRSVSQAASGGLPTSVLSMLTGTSPTGGEAGAMMLEALPRLASPYQLNPANFNPLSGLLDRCVDFEALRHPRAPCLLVSATNVHSGRAHLFDNAGVTASALLASACLPTLFQAVEIEGEYYWDGGFSINPPLLALARRHRRGDLILVQLNPEWRATVPTAPSDIANRVRQLNFNAGLLRELEFLGSLPWFSRWRLPRMHHIHADGHLDELGSHAPLNTDWRFLTRLREAGHERAETWLRGDGRGLGQRGTLSP